MGCITRAVLLDDITRAYGTDPDLSLLLAAEPFAMRFQECTSALRRVVAQAALADVPISVFASSLAYFDQIRAKRLPTALIQGQRNFFSSYTYHRVDKEGVFHTPWVVDDCPEEQWSWFETAAKTARGGWVRGIYPFVLQPILWGSFRKPG